MDYKQVQTGYMLRLAKGEDLFDVLPRFCTEKAISFGTMSGLGAVSYTKCGYYDLDKKEYVLTEYKDFLELVDLNGNVSILDEERVLHIHAAFSKHDNSMLGGHITSMVCGATVEIHLVEHGHFVERKMDGDTGLNLLSLDETYD